MMFFLSYGVEKLKVFISFLNSSHDNIKFTSEYSWETISFLDVLVSMGEGGVLTTDLFCKPADTHVIRGILRRRIPIAKPIGIVGCVRKITNLEIG